MTDKPKKPTKKILKKDQITDLTITLQRVQADFENYKKRVAGERQELLNNAKLAVLADLLPALDNFDRAAMHLPDHLKDDPWAQGMSYVGTQLEQILDEMGVKKFSPAGGEVFDHHRMDALDRVTSDHPPETVAEVLTPGYMIADRVVRPASVRVSEGQQSQLSPDEAVNEGDK